MVAGTGHSIAGFLPEVWGDLFRATCWSGGPVASVAESPFRRPLPTACLLWGGKFLEPDRCVDLPHLFGNAVGVR